MDKPINSLIDDDDDYPAIAKLIELGRQKSYVTIDDILQFFPEAEQDVEQLEETFAALMSAGIPYVEDELVHEEPSDEELTLTDEEAAEAIKLLDGKEVGGRQIVVREARPMEKRDRPSYGGGNGGGHRSSW